MRIILLVFALMLAMSAATLHAQTSILSSGGDASGSGGSAAYSIGQIDYFGSTESGGTVNSGVQQPYEFFTLGIEEDNGICLSLSIYPNPTQSTVQLQIDNQTTEQLAYQVFDMAGKELFGQKIESVLTPIRMESLSVGAYSIKVSTPTSVLKTFTIIKNN
mgnify:CR=1 FL=1